VKEGSKGKGEGLTIGEEKKDVPPLEGWKGLKGIKTEHVLLEGERRERRE